MSTDDDDARFAPPKEASKPLELEEEWQRERAAKAAAAKHPKKHRRPLLIGGVIAALAVIAIVVVGIVMLTKQPKQGATLPDTPGLIGIEIRSLPPATIKLDGHKAGRTPLTVHVPKSDRPIAIEATVVGHPQTKQVVPDHDQRVDFSWQQP